MTDAPKSENLKREQVGEFYLTTASWQPLGGWGGETYETGVRFAGDFRLLQHRGFMWEKAHEYVKQQILDGVKYHDLLAWGDKE